MINYHILSLTLKMGGIDSTINPVLIQTRDDLILCDAGYPAQADQIERELSRHGFALIALTKIFITHHDHDHMGSLAELKRRHPSVKIVAGTEEAEYISGKKTSLRLLQAEDYNRTLTGAERDFGHQFVTYLKTIEPCPVDNIVNDGDLLADGLRVIATPGHTPGHCSLLIDEQSILIAGDALAIEDGIAVIANPQFTLDMPACIRSIRRIMDLHPKAIICYHGGIFSGSIESALAQRLK